MFALGIFFTFCANAILLDVPRPTHPPMWSFVIYVALFGITAVAYGLASVWDLRLLPLAIGMYFLWSLIGKWAAGIGRLTTLSLIAQHARLVNEAAACFACIVLGYVFLIRFIHSIARGNASLQAEVTLARGIHEALVPIVSGQSGHAEFYGRSQASGAIGGDLVDVAEGPEGTTFYIIDVSGHGVEAGVLMAMLKSTARTVLANGASLSTLLGHLNRTVCELHRPGTFSTCACLHVVRDGRIQYGLAGHLPIVQLRSGPWEVRELLAGGPLLGIDERVEYETAQVESTAGDVFLLVTDGLTEVFRRDGRELGMDGIRATAFADPDVGPRELTERIIARATQYSRQLDDQTAMIGRILAGARPTPTLGSS